MRLLGILIPVILIFGYIIINGAFHDFINYTVKGLLEFSNYKSYINLINLNIVGILSILIPITFIYLGIKTIFFSKDEITYVFLVYGLSMFVVCFPISDYIHFFIGSLPTFILILYKIYEYFKKKFKNTNLNKIYIIFFTVFSLSCMICCMLVNFYIYFFKSSYSKLNYYSYIPISKEDEAIIQNIYKYINDSTKKQ